MPVPQFEDRSLPDRILPPGVHRVTMGEIEEALVTPFSTKKRLDIFLSWSAFRDLVRKYVQVEQEFVDGSFVTSRPEPDDIDFSLHVKVEELETLATHERLVFQRFLKSSAPSYRCHVFLVPLCDPTHVDYPSALKAKVATTKLWKAYKDPLDLVRQGVEKGYLEVVE